MQAQCQCVSSQSRHALGDVILFPTDSSPISGSGSWRPQATYQNQFLTVETQIEIRSLTDVESHPAGGLGSVKNFGNSLKMGGQQQI